MYTNFYKMERPPFHITPDPEFLFLSSSHKEALGAIIYCIAGKKGFVSIIGEVGSGKTTIVRSYLSGCDRRRVKPIYLFNPSVTFAELLKAVFLELGITAQSERVSDMVRQLHIFLIGAYEKGHNVVLIVDEAQNMPVATFEQLRILSNLETPKDKLLQIVLVGQPELQEKLAGKELRQLNQRLAIRSTLRLLSPKESRDYILFRLAKVTRNPERIFTAAALKKIVKEAKGSPRMLNILCDNALVAGFGDQKKQITGEMAKQVITDFKGKGRPQFFTLKLSFLSGALLLIVFALYEIQPFPSFARFISIQGQQSTSTDSPSRVEAAMPTESPVLAQGIKQPESVSPGFRGQVDVSRTDEQASISLSRNENGTIREGRNMPINGGKKRTVFSGTNSREMYKAAATTRTVRKGEYLSQICQERYGFVNDRVIKAVKGFNPHILNADLIFSGEKIFLPELNELQASLADFRVR